MSPSYPKYKPSGVEWLGDVPEHWDVKRSAGCYNIQLGKMLQPEPQNQNDIQISYLKALHVQWEKITVDELPTMWAAKQEISKYEVKNGDLLVCEGGEVGRAGMLKGLFEKAIIQNALHRVRSNNNSIVFLMYVLEYASTQNWFNILCNKSTIAHFTGEKFAALKIPVPSFLEQQTIADYLDRETGKIDTLIEKKELLIARLKEKRTALISLAVTKGLDPKVKLKPSGVEWLGDVPEHWEVVSLRHLFRIKAGGDLKEEFYSEEKTKQFPFPIYTNSIKSDEAYGFSSKVFFKSNTITVTGRGEIGYAVYRDHEYDAIIRLLVLTPKNNAPCKYFAYFINSMLYFFGGSTAVSQLSTEQISPYKVFSPPLREQQAIADYLDRETGKIDALIEKVVDAVAKLREYRTALISAAVTGKIDVRKKHVDKVDGVD